MGAVILCMHLDGESHRVTPEAHEAEGHHSCNHDEAHSEVHSHATDHDHKHCIDTEIKLDELDEANPKVERLNVKSPTAASFAVIDLDDLALDRAELRIQLKPVRGPPGGRSATLAMVKTTVLRI